MAVIDGDHLIIDGGRISIERCKFVNIDGRDIAIPDCLWCPFYSLTETETLKIFVCSYDNRDSYESNGQSELLRGCKLRSIKESDDYKNALAKKKGVL